MMSEVKLRRVVAAEKGSRLQPGRACRSKKRKFHGNVFTKKSTAQPEEGTASKRKLFGSADLKFNVDEDCEYVILNFKTVFSRISEIVKCKICGSDVNFSQKNIRGLGFKLVIKCSKCGDCGKVNSCNMTGTKQNEYEVNLRSVVAMRMLGVGHTSLQTFCGVMDLHSPITHTPFLTNQKKLGNASVKVATDSMARAAREELARTVKDNDLVADIPNSVSVSGDGSWRKRGHNSLMGVATIIGHRTGKVLDATVKSKYCQECIYWESKKETDLQGYLEWIDEHAFLCKATHEGSAASMEVEGMLDIFRRSEELHGLKYLRFIGDGDSATHKALVDSKPYGDLLVEKKECVQHVQKRMGTRLRELKKKSGKDKLVDGKTMGGKGRLTGSLIDQLSQYYGNAIRDNTNSVYGMKNSVWASFYHVGSTDESPQHHLCPQGENTWCKFWKSKLEKAEYHHEHPVPDAIMKAIRPIYENLTNDTLLEKCLGGYSQNANESLHSKIWKLAPKHLFSGTETVEIATSIGIATFNDGMVSLLQMLQEMGIQVGRHAVNMTKLMDAERLSGAEEAAQETTKEARISKRLRRAAEEEQARQDEGAVYQAGGF